MRNIARERNAQQFTPAERDSVLRQAVLATTLLADIMESKSPAVLQDYGNFDFERLGALLDAMREPRFKDVEIGPKCPRCGLYGPIEGSAAYDSRAKRSCRGRQHPSNDYSRVKAMKREWRAQNGKKSV